MIYGILIVSKDNKPPSRRENHHMSMHDLYTVSIEELTPDFDVAEEMAYINAELYGEE